MPNKITRKQQAALSRTPANQRAQLQRSYQQQQRPTPRPAVNQPRRRATMPVPRMLSSSTQGPRRRGVTSSGIATGLKLAKIWDPLNTTPIPTAVSDGHAHVTTGMDRFDLKVGSGSGSNFVASKAMVIVTNTGADGCCGLVYSWNTTGVKVSSIVLPTLAGNPLEGSGPTAGRAMKCSLTILNSTPSRRVGGTVSFLNATQRIVWPTDTVSQISMAQADEIFKQVKKQQQTVLRTGEDYKSPKTSFAYPGNETEYIGFRTWEGTDQADDVAVGDGTVPDTTGLKTLKDVDRFLFSVSTATPFNDPDDTTGGHVVPNTLTVGPYGFWEPKRRPMSTLVFLIDAPSEEQTYTFTVRASYYTRWPMAHVLGQHHPPIPASSPGVVSHLRDAGEHFGQVMHDISDTIGSVGGGIQRAVGTAYQARGLYNGLRMLQNGGMTMGNASTLALMVD